MKRPTILSKTGPLPDYIYRSYVEFFRSGRIPPVAVLARWDDAITAETFKNLAAKMKLCGSTLICVATGLPMVCQEKFEFLVVKVHTRGGHPGPGHRGLLSTCVNVRRKYSIGEIHFGITEVEVRRIALRCPDPDCTHRLWKQKFTTGRWLDVRPMVFHKHNEENVSQHQPLGAIDLTIEPARTNVPLDLSQNLEFPKGQFIPGQVTQSMQWCIGLGSPMKASFEDEIEVITIDSSPEVIDNTSGTAPESTIGASLHTEEREYVDLDDLMEIQRGDNRISKANDQAGKSKPIDMNHVKTNNIQNPLGVQQVAETIRTPSKEKTELQSPALLELLCHNVTKPARPKVPVRHTQRRFVDLIHIIHSMRSDIPKVMVNNEEATVRLKNKIERGLEVIADAAHGDCIMSTSS